MDRNLTDVQSTGSGVLGPVQTDATHDLPTTPPLPVSDVWSETVLPLGSPSSSVLPEGPPPPDRQTLLNLPLFHPVPVPPPFRPFSTGPSHLPLPSMLPSPLFVDGSSVTTFVSHTHTHTYVWAHVFVEVAKGSEDRSRDPESSPGMGVGVGWCPKCWSPVLGPFTCRGAGRDRVGVTRGSRTTVGERQEVRNPGGVGGRRWTYGVGGHLTTPEGPRGREDRHTENR